MDDNDKDYRDVPAETLYEAGPDEGLERKAMEEKARQDRLTEISTHLMFVGVPVPEVKRLLSNYEPERIERQLRWLPYRRPRKPSSLIVAAIEGDYGPPVSVRGTYMDEPPADEA